MRVVDRIRKLFGGKPSGAESVVVAGGTVAATSHDDPSREAETQSGSDWSGGGESGGTGRGGDGGGGGGG